MDEALQRRERGAGTRWRHGCDMCVMRDVCGMYCAPPARARGGRNLRVFSMKSRVAGIVAKSKEGLDKMAVVDQILHGAFAGAAGTAALNIATYADMTARGRGSSEVPAKVAGHLTEAIGLDLEAQANGNDQASEKQKTKAQQRLSGLGALMGYTTGLSVGVLYGLARPYLGRVSLPLAGIALGAAAMAGSDAPATITGATNPKTWGMSGWLSDIVPHLIYGLVTAAAYESYASGK